MNNVANVVESLKAIERSRQDRYRQLVADLADNVSVEPADVFGVLDSVGGSPDGLAADVDRLRQRRELVAIVAGKPDLEAERGALRRERQRLVSALEAAQRQFGECIAPLNLREMELQATATQIQSAELELRRTAAPESKGRMQDLSARLADVQRRRNDVGTLVARNVHIADERHGRAARAGTPATIAAYRAEAAAAEARNVEHAATLTTLDVEIAALVAEQKLAVREVVSCA